MTAGWCGPAAAVSAASSAEKSAFGAGVPGALDTAACTGSAVAAGAVVVGTVIRRPPASP